MNAKYIVIAAVLVVVVGISIFIMKQLDSKLNQLTVMDMRLRLLQHSILTDCQCGGSSLNISDATETRVQNLPSRNLYLIMNRPSSDNLGREMRMEPIGKHASDDCLKREECTVAVDRTFKSSDGVLGRVFIKVF